IGLEDLNKRGDKMAAKHSHEHDLIISVVNHGNSDELMNTAHKAGARGGTVIHARGDAHQGAVKFFGISVQDEKELILILAGRDNKTAVMKAICEAHGLNTEAQGIIFSLPVDNVMGLSLDE
ncbi:MAG: P-II family nitrogen regulator, partial [Treponema sp.]|nr:P-II family nitrogen regulator [Treponema sp.]